MNVIVWTQENGTVAVCIPTGELPIEKVFSKDVPAGVAARIVDINSLPLPLNDPAFGAIRMADDGTFSVDATEAHRLTTPPTPEQKLATAGLTVAELKTLLALP